jgi:hypothetical protein
VIGDQGENVVKIEFRIEAIEFGGAEQRVDHWKTAGNELFHSQTL